MTDSQQKCFLSVAEMRSFSKAANALYVSQPAVSKNISTLEAELGTALFDRQGKDVELTRAGEIFHGFLLEYRREFDNMMHRIKGLDQGAPHGTIRIGCDFTWNAAHFYSRLSRHFAIHFPGIQLEVEGMAPDAFLTALRRKEIDVLIMHEMDLERHADIESVHLTSIESGFLCSSALTHASGSELRDLKDYPFLIAGGGGEAHKAGIYRRHIGDICARHGFTPSFRNCKSLSAGLVEVSCGKGLLFADCWTSAINNSEYSYISTGDSTDICLVHLPGPSDSLISLFTEETVKVFEGNL